MNLIIDIYLSMATSRTCLHYGEFAIAAGKKHTVMVTAGFDNMKAFFV